MLEKYLRHFLPRLNVLSLRFCEVIPYTLMRRCGKHFRHLFDWGSQNYVKRSAFGLATKTYRRNSRSISRPLVSVHIRSSITRLPITCESDETVDYVARAAPRVTEMYLALVTFHYTSTQYVLTINFILIWILYLESNIILNAGTR